MKVAKVGLLVLVGLLVGGHLGEAAIARLPSILDRPATCRITLPVYSRCDRPQEAVLANQKELAQRLVNEMCRLPRSWEAMGIVLECNSLAVLFTQSVGKSVRPVKLVIKVVGSEATADLRAWARELVDDINSGEVFKHREVETLE